LAASLRTARVETRSIFGKDRRRHASLLTVVGHQGEPEHAGQRDARGILVAQLSGALDERILKLGGVETPDLETLCISKRLRRRRFLGAHSIGVGRGVQEQRFAVGLIADEETQITGLNDLDLDPSREHVQRATRVYYERARHRASCHPQIARREVDRKLRFFVDL
jgi:hypothetical protein